MRNNQKFKTFGQHIENIKKKHESHDLMNGNYFLYTNNRKYKR